MTILAKGAEQVRRLQHALRGGEAPLGAIEASKARIHRDVAERFEARKAAHAKMARLTERRRQRLLAHVSMDDPDIIQEAQDARTHFETLRQRRLPKPMRRMSAKSEPCVVTGSLEWWMNPPLDGAGFWPPPQEQFSNSDATQQAEADASIGAFSVNLQVSGGGASAAVACSAGVYVTFVAPPGLATVQRFSAVVGYNYFYWDAAALFTSDNDLTTQFLIWGETENDWVGQADISPSWSHHDTWLAQQSDEKTNQLYGGSAYFQAGPSQNYIAWVTCAAFASADGGSVYGGFALSTMNALVEYVAFSEVIVLPPF